MDGVQIIKFKREFNEGNYEIKTKLELKGVTDAEAGEFLKVILSDGSEQGIKILPEDAMIIARNNLKIGKGIEEIEIREEVHNNVPRAVLHFNSDKTGRFLGLWKIKARFEATIDPETGEVLSSKGPWWAFLLTGENREFEEDNRDKGNKTDNNKTDDDNGDNNETGGDNNETNGGGENNETGGGDNNETNGPGNETNETA